MRTKTRIVIVGAGIGGLSAALRLAHAGCDVTVVERQAAPGGKMRTLPTLAGPVDAGPTVLTMLPVFEALFADVGLTLSDHVTLRRLATLARHYWSDGSTFDLMADPDESAARIAAAFGGSSADDFRRFSTRAARLMAAFEGPMMQSPTPSQTRLALQVMRQPRLLADMAPHQTLAQLATASFREPRLAQLFARYATYVGGRPAAAPALLSLIWDAEARGVWTVDGGMHALAATVARLAAGFGAHLRYDTTVTQIVRQGDRVTGIDTDAGRIDADMVLFNGDPAALHDGLLGQAARPAVPHKAVFPRSLSAHVASFAAVPTGVALAHHTVFFADKAEAEFDAIVKGGIPQDATLYICAQDAAAAPGALQRFEIIRNAAPLSSDTPPEEFSCQSLIFDRLRRFGLTFSPGPVTVTGPADFAALFPGSRGSLYGRSPQGLTSALQRPLARTAVPGLYLCGGGAHPGAGVPMATLSGQHAAAAMLQDLASTRPSRRTAMRGGMSTASVTTVFGRSRS
ncbi:1-hydroxycarotenoid 3,4-desaturase [Loktanella fryxellensis]|uniref:1-hydroxycarotenoid 3,4-desaturase n=1 Tax=Loktanella fryxellensis TaxID=245187 RepID=A0A1H7ZYU3_9RHOB|nr:1-hydroxycarotenoid 3,4-desaturase CrtD [Loktanella fryxellensis]SEM62669.1 1-hydroxycarotenoid 3,4-desaturase [Loktanella fryxellensis]